MSKGTAIVTGSSQGLGRYMAVELAKAGYTIVLHYFNSEEAGLQTLEAVKSYQENSILLKADLTVAEETRAFFDAVDAAGLPPLKLLIQNVGNYLKKDLLETSLEEWKHMMDSNLNCSFQTAQLSIKRMRRHKAPSNIIFLGFSSLGSFRAETEIGPYYIAKSGLWLLTKSLAKSLADKNIRVNMISPGVLETSVSKPVSEIPAGRLGQLSEIQSALNFLISEENPYLTGQNIEVAGGWRL